MIQKFSKFVTTFLFEDVIRRNKILDILILQFLIFCESDAGGKIVVSIKIDNMNVNFTNICYLIIRGQFNFVFGVSLSFLTY